jgi:hypothetical protein
MKKKMELEGGRTELRGRRYGEKRGTKFEIRVRDRARIYYLMRQ